MAINWTPNLSVGNEHLDSQHKKLLGKIDELSEAVSNNKGEEIIEEILKFFMDYANEHFLDEEKYMEENNYPYLEEHVDLHRAFTTSYQDFKKKMEEGITKELTIEIQNFLMKWWLSHIEVEDHKYYVYIEHKGS